MGGVLPSDSGQPYVPLEGDNKLPAEQKHHEKVAKSSASIKPALESSASQIDLQKRRFLLVKRELLSSWEKRAIAQLKKESHGQITKSQFERSDNPVYRQVAPSYYKREDVIKLINSLGIGAEKESYRDISGLVEKLESIKVELAKTEGPYAAVQKHVKLFSSLINTLIRSIRNKQKLAVFGEWNQLRRLTDHLLEKLVNTLIEKTGSKDFTILVRDIFGGQIYKAYASKGSASQDSKIDSSATVRYLDQTINAWYRFDDVVDTLKSQCNFINDKLTAAKLDPDKRSHLEDLQALYATSLAQVQQWHSRHVNHPLMFSEQLLLKIMDKGTGSADELSKYLRKDILSDLTRLLRSHVTTYFSKREIEGIRSNPRFKGLDIKSLKPCFKMTEDVATKEGVENLRELLAARSAAILGLADCLAIKHPEPEKDPAKLTNAISSRVLDPFPVDDFLQYLQFKSYVPYFEAKKYKYESELKTDHDQTSDLKAKLLDVTQSLNECKQGISNLEARIFSADFILKLGQLVLLDLIYCSTDSHINQYKLDSFSGTVKTIDFARFAPFDVVANNSKGETYAHLRSALLCCMAAETLLSEDLIQLIRDWDIDSIAKSHQVAGLISTASESGRQFENYGVVLADRQLYKTASDDVHVAIPQELIKKYAIQPGADRNLQLAELLAGVERAENALKFESFQKIDFNAFQGVIDRMKQAQAYINKHENPTFLGLRDAIYPELSIFLHVLDKCKGAATGLLIARYSLEEIKAMAEEKNLVSHQELELMGQSIKELSARGAKYSDMYNDMFQFISRR